MNNVETIPATMLLKSYPRMCRLTGVQETMPESNEHFLNILQSIDSEKITQGAKYIVCILDAINSIPEKWERPGINPRELFISRYIKGQKVQELAFDAGICTNTSRVIQKYSLNCFVEGYQQAKEKRGFTDLVSITASGNK